MAISTVPVWQLMEVRNAFAAVGVAAVLMWPYAPNMRTAIMIQCLGSAGLAIYFAVGGSTTAAASCAIAMAQLIAAALVEDRAKRNIFYLASLALLGVCVLMNWEGWPSLLVGSGTAFATYARTQNSAFRMKKWFLIGSPFWLVHNLITANYFALVIDALSIVSSGWSVLEDDRNVAVFAWPKDQTVKAYA